MTKSKIPQFKDEKEESEFWDTHDSTQFFDEFEEVDIDIIDARPRLKQISLRLDPHTIDALKNIAATKGIGYKTMMRMWIVERLGQETV